MLISYKKLKEFVDFDYSASELDNILTMLGVEVEKIFDNGKKYENFFVAYVNSAEKHPDADKLTVCNLALADKNLQVICGAPNVAQGQKVVLGVSGAIVPSGGFKLEKKKIKGLESKGMICSQKELDLGEDSDGIWVLPEDAPVGTKISEYFDLDDILFEISVTPNKADCLSHLGIAREIAAYMGKNVKKIDITLNESDSKTEDFVKVIIESPENCPRYTARVVKNITSLESPDWLKKHLSLIGLRSINAPADVTNYVMYEMGQPLHAFDLDTVAQNTIIVRNANDGDKFTSLDGKERNLDSQMLMICDAEKPVAIGGVMGGQNSEITDSTKNILIESAFFNPSSVRRTSKKLALQSDSSYRFERGVDIDNVTTALDRAAQLIHQICGGELTAGIVDNYPNIIKKKKIELRFARANKIIGLNQSNEEICSLLQRLGFVVLEQDKHSALIEVPSQRVDVFEEIDLIEEIARLYNYDNIEPNYTSSIDFKSEGIASHLSVPPLRRKIRNYFVQNGFNEIITQVQIDPKYAEIYTENPVRISNPLGEELSIMRPSALPSMLKIIRHNINNGNHNLRIFEIGKAFSHVENSVKTHLDGFLEIEELCVALVGLSAPIQWGTSERKVDFYDIKGIVQDLFEFLKLEKFELIADENTPDFSAQSLAIKTKAGVIGTFGLVKAEILKKFSIDVPVYIAKINFTLLNNEKVKVSKYSKVSAYPVVQRDLAFVFDKSVKAEDIRKEVFAQGGKLLTKVVFFDLYEGKNLGVDKKSLAFSMSFSSLEQTLTDVEVESAVKNVIEKVSAKFGGILRA